MVVLNVKENSIDLAELKQSLTEEFYTIYKIHARKNLGVVLAKTNITGVTVILKNNKLYISSNFPKSWMVALYTFSLIFLAFVPFVLYHIFLHKKMKIEEQKVSAFLKEVYADKIFV